MDSSAGERFSPAAATAAISLCEECKVMGMPEALTAGPDSFIDRRNSTSFGAPPGRERRQFADSHDELSPDGKELAQAIDAYKLMHRRRFITHDEMLGVFKALGYHR